MASRTRCLGWRFTELYRTITRFLNAKKLVAVFSLFGNFTKLSHQQVSVQLKSPMWIKVTFLHLLICLIDETYFLKLVIILLFPVKVEACDTFKAIVISGQQVVFNQLEGESFFDLRSR